MPGLRDATPGPGSQRHVALGARIAKSASMADALADPANFLGDAELSPRSIWQLDRRRVYRGKANGNGPGPSAERPPSRG